MYSLQVSIEQATHVNILFRFRRFFFFLRSFGLLGSSWRLSLSSLSWGSSTTTTDAEILIDGAPSSLYEAFCKARNNVDACLSIDTLNTFLVSF